MRMIGGLDYYVAVKQVRVGMMCMSAMMMMMYVGGDDVGVMMWGLTSFLQTTFDIATFHEIFQRDDDAADVMMIHALNSNVFDHIAIVTGPAWELSKTVCMHARVQMAQKVTQHHWSSSPCSTCESSAPQLCLRMLDPLLMMFW